LQTKKTSCKAKKKSLKERGLVREKMSEGVVISQVDHNGMDGCGGMRDDDSRV